MTKKRKKNASAGNGSSGPAVARKPLYRHPRVPNLAITFTEPTRTKQSFKDECDINLIIKKYKQTGQITHLANSQGEYGFATSQTFDQAMRIVADAQSQFEELPATVRAHFDNNPAAFLDAAQDESRRSEFVDLGLIIDPIPSEGAPSELPLEGASSPPNPTSEAEKDPE